MPTISLSYSGVITSKNHTAATTIPSQLFTFDPNNLRKYTWHENIVDIVHTNLNDVHLVGNNDDDDAIDIGGRFKIYSGDILTEIILDLI